MPNEGTFGNLQISVESMDDTALLLSNRKNLRNNPDQMLEEL